MANDGTVKIGVKIDNNGLKTDLRNVEKTTKKTFDELAKESGRTVDELKEDAKRIAEEYQKQGMSIPSSYKKAYADMGVYSESASKKMQESAQKAAEKSDYHAEKTADSWKDSFSDMERESESAKENLSDDAEKEKKAHEEASSKSSSAWEKAFSKMQNIAKAGAKATISIVTAASVAIAGATAVGIGYNSTIEGYQTSFEVMTGSAEKAVEITDKLKKIGAETPFELSGLADTTQLLMNYGFTADDAIDRMKMLGDISQGSADKMTRIANAYGQMSSAGKVSLEDVKQMIEAGFNPLQEISESTGESMSSLYDRISKGKISVDEITESMKRATSEGGKYYQSMEKQSKTFSGQISTLKDNASALIGEVVQPISDSMTQTLLPEAINTIDELTDAFQRDGLDGLVQAAGDAFADIVSESAAQAPKMVDVAVDFIQSFIKGAAKNKGKLLVAAKDIVKTLVCGLTDLLPPSVRTPVKKAIKEIEKSFESGGLKKAVNTAGKIMSGLGDVVTKLTRKVLPPFTKAIDFCADNLDTILPIVLAVMAAFKAYTVINAASKALSTVSASSGICSTAVQLLTGKITLASAAQEIWNMMLSANPIALVVTAVAGLAAGLGALAIMQGDVLTGEEKLQIAQENLGESFGNVGKAAAEFNDGIKNAGSVFDGINESILVSSEVQQELADKMDAVQTEITEIARTASDERRQLTQEEITRLDELFQKMQELTAQELAIQQQRQDAVESAATSLVNSRVEEASAYEEQAQRIINSAEQERDSIIDTAYQQMIEKNAINQQLLGTSAEYNDAWLAQQQQAAQDEYQAAIGAANQKCADTLSIVQQGYYDQFVAQNNALSSSQSANKAVEDENSRHQAEMEAIQSSATYAITDMSSEAVAERIKIQDREKKENDKHKENLAKIWNEMTGNMDTASADQIGAWLTMLAHTELYGGQISGEASAQVDAFLAAYEKMPEETRESMRNAMSPMLEEMQNSEPTLFNKAEGIAGGILSRLKKAFDIHSPSKKTRKIFRQVMQGAEIGVDEEKKGLYGKFSEVANDVMERLRDIDIGCTMDRIKAAISTRHASLSASTSAQEFYHRGSDPQKEDETNGENTSVYQTVNIYQPVKSPVETAREIKKVGRELAFGK